MEDKKISGVELPRDIGETPPSTPVPQASSTAAHRPEESNSDEVTVHNNVEEESYETRLSDIIGGLRLLGNKLQDRESEIFKERAIVRSESSSSLGILQPDEMQSLPSDTLDEDIQNLMQNFEAALASANKPSEDICEDKPTDTSIVSENQEHASDLAIDLRVRLQKELAQRTMERFSLPETPRPKSSCSSIFNKSFQEGSTVNRETFTISKWPTEQSLNNDQGLLKTEEDANDPYFFLNEAKCSSSFMTGDKVAQFPEYSNENFVPGEQCEELLVCDEEVWTEENLPPVADPPANPSTSQLEFSGVAANTEITLPNVSKYLGNLNSKVSIGQYFRLKSEDPDTLTDRCSVIFATNDHVKDNEQHLKDNTDRDSINTTLSLSQIAGILGKLDSAMSPRTLVADFLKQATSTKGHSSSIPKITYSDGNNDRTSYGNQNGSRESEETEWRFDVPRRSEGLGSRAYSIVTNEAPRKESVPEAQRTITIEDSLAAGDLSVLKLDENADESVICLTNELINKPKESIDCSALVPTLKKHCPSIWSDNQPSKFIDAEAFTDCRSPSPISRVPQDMDSEMNWADSITPETPIICVGVPKIVEFPIINTTARWLICSLDLGDIKLPGGEPDNENLAMVRLPPKTVLMDPNSKRQAAVEVIPLFAGLVVIELQINMEDVVTKATQTVYLIISVIGEEPTLTFLFDTRLKLMENEGNDPRVPLLDIGAIPEECMEQFTLTLFNKGRASVPLQLRTHTQVPAGFELFFLLPEDKIDYSKVSYLEALNSRKLLLEAEVPPGKEFKMILFCATPALKLFTEKEGFYDLFGYLVITLLSVTPLDLQQFQFSGILGTTKFALQVASQPLKLTSTGLGRSGKHCLPLKNCGLLPFSLLFKILDAEDRPLRKDDFTVRPPDLILKPGHTDEAVILYTPSNLQQVPLYRTLLIQMQPFGPQYYIELVGTIVKPTVERKAVSPVQLHNKIQSLNDSLSSTSERSQDFKSTIHVQKDKERIISGSPLLSRSLISQNTRTSSGSNSDSASGCEKMRIQSTRRELVWGSVDVGKTVMRSCSIRSLSEHRCRMQISITDKNNVYKLMNEKGELVTQRKTMLHYNELLVVNVMFNPSKTGPLPARLTFTHLHDHSEDTSSVHIPLYGCGGHARLVVKGIPRDGAARLWLTLQQQDSEEELFWESRFSVRNIGDLPAFLIVGVVSKGFHHVNESSFIVEPSELVIPKGGTEDIRVFCRPRPQDLKLLLSGNFQDVIEVAAINLISGDEPTRHRLRRLHKKMKQNDVQEEKYTEMDLAAVTAPFPGERVIPKLDSLRESLEYIHELYHCVCLQEVIVLLENNNDRTIQEADTSRVFHSLYEVDISRTRVEETTCYNVQEETLFTDIPKSPSKCSWYIDPTTLTISPPLNICAVFRLKSDSNRKQPFETAIPTHPPGWILSVNPSTGFIPASDELVLVVSCSPSSESSSSRPLSWKGVIQVFIENDLKEVKVSVQSSQRAKQDLRPVSQPRNILPVSSTSRTNSRSPTGTLRRTEKLLQIPSEQPQKRSPTKGSRIPVPSAPPTFGYVMSDSTEHELNRNVNILQQFPKSGKKSPNSKR